MKEQTKTLNVSDAERFASHAKELKTLRNHLATLNKTAGNPIRIAFNAKRDNCLTHRYTFENAITLDSVEDYHGDFVDLLAECLRGAIERKERWFKERGVKV